MFGSAAEKKFVTGYLVGSRPNIDLDNDADQSVKPSTKALGKRPQLMANGCKFHHLGTGFACLTLVYSCPNDSI